MPAISRDEVEHLARLSRLALTEQELDAFSDQLDSILGHVRAIAEVDTDGVEPMSHPIAVKGVTREDVIRPGLAPEQALDMAPDTEEQRFAVPQILGEAE